MIERIQKQIDRLEELREDVLVNYLAALDAYKADMGSMEAVERAGILHDLDRHLTNLRMEVRRIEALKGVALV